MNDWMHRWYHALCYHLQCFSIRSGMLAWNGMQMTRRDNSVLGSNLSRLINRALTIFDGGMGVTEKSKGTLSQENLSFVPEKFES